MKRDPYNHKDKWVRWKDNSLKKGIQGISKANSELILRYLLDMEKGLNVSTVSVKGPRSPIRLNTLKDRMVFFARQFEEKFNLNSLTELTEEQLFTFFSDMQSGAIKTRMGTTYKSLETFSKIIKTFWHWHQKVMRKKGTSIADITQDLDSFRSKPKWVYLDESQVKRLCNSAKYDYKVLFMFLLDTGIRSPSELINVKVSDLHKNYSELNIREEVVKKGSFGRRIKLMLCSDLLVDYIETKGLTNNDYVFDIKPYTANKYVKTLTVRLFGDEVSEAGKKYSEISLYDFRHISCCYWLPRYKSESALMFRFGWKKSDKIHYYSELLGMRDTINEEDLLIDTTKTELEQRMSKLEQENQILKDKLMTLDKYMKIIDELSVGIKKKVESISE